MDDDGILYGNEDGDWIRADDVDAELARLRERVGELEAIVDRLPRTADGVPVTPGDMIFMPASGDAIEVARFRNNGCYPIYIRGKSGELEPATLSVPVKVEECYSTRSAAEAAMKKEGV
jgi:hypothetical protein